MSQTRFKHDFKQRTNQSVSVHFSSSLLPLHSKPPSIVPLPGDGHLLVDPLLLHLLPYDPFQVGQPDRFFSICKSITWPDPALQRLFIALKRKFKFIQVTSCSGFYLLLNTHIWPLSSLAPTTLVTFFFPLHTKLIPSSRPWTSSFLSWACSCQRASSCLSGVRLIPPLQWEIPQHPV